jgi:CMP-N-acetylneuraminic acid synthetase
MKILGIVPARKGSKRVVGKNVRPLGGKPMCQWVMEMALAAKRLDRIVVSSDDERVLEIAHSFGENLPLVRPAELAQDKSPAVDYVFHALEVLESRGEGPYDAVCIMPAASPFALPSDVDATIDLFAKTGAETAVSVVELEHAVHPFKMKVLEGDRLLPYVEEERGRMAAHQLPKIYVRNCAIYVSKRSVFFEYKQIVGTDMRGYVMPAERSVDINSEIDFAFAEFLLTRRASH